MEMACEICLAFKSNFRSCNNKMTVTSVLKAPQEKQIWLKL